MTPEQKKALQEFLDKTKGALNDLETRGTNEENVRYWVEEVVNTFVAGMDILAPQFSTPEEKEFDGRRYDSSGGGEICFNPDTPIDKFVKLED